MKKVAVLLFIFSFLISGCSQETNLYLKSENNWEFTTEITLNMGLLPEFGTDIISGLGIRLDSGEMMDTALEITFNQLVNHYRMKGLAAHLETPMSSNSDETYKIFVGGQGWNSLEQLTAVDPQALQQLPGLDWDSISTKMFIEDIDSEKVRFSLILPDDPIGLRGLSQFTFKLHGKEIVNCNGCVVEDGTATWFNPMGSIEAVLVPGTPINPILLIVLISIGVIFGIAALLLAIRFFVSRRSPSHKARISPGRRDPRRRPQGRRSSGRFSR